jgi:hypothetical protein
VSRVVRRSLVLAVLALVALPFTAIGSSAQEIPDDLVIRVGTEVVGTGTGPSSVTLDCVGNAEAGALDTAVLNFDAQGHPTTATVGFEIENGLWVTSGNNGAGGECDYTETNTGGASSTTWTCAHEFDPVEVPAATQIEQAGCAATSGAGIGPVHVVYPGDDEVADQASTVIFVNTFIPEAPLQPAAQVVAKPAFTG